MGGSWLKYLLLIPLILLTFAFCLFHKIIISYITKGMTEPPTKMMIDLKQLIKCMAPYMISDCNSITLGMKRCNEREYFPGP